VTGAPSFRDPAGCVLDLGERVLRVITDPEAAAALSRVLQLSVVGRAVADGRLVASRPVPKQEWPDLAALRVGGDVRVILEHERIAFPSFAYEWPAEMLHAAGRLTLDLALALLEEGHGLKDATPYNVLFEGPRPVFVDLGSLEAREPDDYTWLAHAQFARTFLLPLLARRDLALPLAGLLLAKRDGLEPEQVYRMIGPLRRLMPPYLGYVSLPTWLARAARKRGAALYQRRRGGHPERSRYVLSSTLRRLARPSAGIGWRNAECPAFLDRAQARFDLVLMLAVVHHLVVSERIPIEQIAELIACLTRDAAVVEFVGREDPMFERLLRGRDHLHRDWTRAAFELAWRRVFDVVACEQIDGGHRWLYLFRKRKA